MAAHGTATSEVVYHCMKIFHGDSSYSCSTS